MWQTVRKLCKKNSERKAGLLLPLLVAVLLLWPHTAVNAAGTTTIYMNNTSPSVGDVFSTTVQGSAEDTITVSYDNTLVHFEGANVAYTQDGNRITFQGTSATLQFSATAAGSGYVSATAANLDGSSVIISISDGSQSNTDTAGAADAQTPAADDAADTSNTDAADPANADGADDAAAGAVLDSSFTGDFLIDGVSYVMSERFTDSEVPAGFTRADVTVHGTDTYSEVKSDFLTLVYLKPEDNTAGSGVFYIYDEATDSVSPLYLLGTMDDYVIIRTPDMLPTLLMWESTLTVDEKEYPCYLIEGIVPDGFYFIYGVRQDGEARWYQYDDFDRSIQRANTEVLALLTAEDEGPAAPAEDVAPVPEEGSFDLLGWIKEHKTLLAIIAFVIVLLIVIIINIRVFREKSEEEDWEFDEEDDELSEDGDDEDDDVVLRMKQKKEKKRAARKEEKNVPESSEEAAEAANVADAAANDTEDMPESIAAVLKEAVAEAKAETESASDKANRAKEEIKAASSRDDVKEKLIRAKEEAERAESAVNELKAATVAGAAAAQAKTAAVAGTAAAQAKATADSAAARVTEMTTAGAAEAAKAKAEAERLAAAAEAAQAAAKETAKSTTGADMELPEIQILDLNDL